MKQQSIVYFKILFSRLMVVIILSNAGTYIHLVLQEVKLIKRLLFAL